MQFTRRPDAYALISQTPTWKLIGVSIIVAEVLTFSITGPASYWITGTWINSYSSMGLVAGFLVPLLITWIIFKLAKEITAVKFELEVKDSAMKSITNGIAITDSAGNIMYANPAFFDFFGIAPSTNLVGKSIADIWRLPTPFRDIMANINTAKNLYTGEIAVGSRYAMVTANIVADTTKKMTWIAFLFFDITEQKNSTQALERANESLQRLNKMFVDRELRMVELKEENKRLRGKDLSEATLSSKEQATIH